RSLPDGCLAPAGGRPEHLSSAPRWKGRARSQGRRKRALGGQPHRQGASYGKIRKNVSAIPVERQGHCPAHREERQWSVEMREQGATTRDLVSEIAPESFRLDGDEHQV